MARGWESKSVENQVEQFQSGKDQKQKNRLSAEDAEKTRRKGVLELARTRIKADLESCRDPAYERQLRGALEHIEAQLAQTRT